MNGLKIMVFLFWGVLTSVTVYAFLSLGGEGGMVFFTDFAHPWRAQFNTDFLMHIFLFSVWVFYREQSKVVGLVAALLSLLGGLFTLLYLGFAMQRAKGDVRKFLLGCHA